MAKRFGRNQRRKLREEVAQLKSDLADREVQIQCVRVNHRTLVKAVTNWDTMIRNTLGKDSRFRMMIETRSGRYGTHSDGTFRMWLQPQIELSDQIYDSTNIAEMYQHVNMAVSFLDTHRDEYSRQLRFILHHGDNSSGYACDVESIVDNARNDPAYVDHLSQEIAKGLAAHIG